MTEEDIIPKDKRLCLECGATETFKWYRDKTLCGKCYKKEQVHSKQNKVGKKFCECGCGEYIPEINTRGKPARFKTHHNQKVQPTNWRGGRRIDSQGYVCVYKPEHPRAWYGYIYEHILVMEQYLGRYLVPPDDEVHHINGNKQDNRIENLELMSHTEHARFETSRRHKEKH